METLFDLSPNGLKMYEKYGIIALNRNSIYTVKAKKVILATGGIDGKAEMVDRYIPEIKGAVIWNCAGADGDAVTLTEKLDTVVHGYGMNDQCCVDTLEAAVADGLCYKADTLEELAALTGVDAAGMVVTVEKYNEDYAAGGDTLFGVNLNRMTSVQQAPYYAVSMLYQNLGVFVGLKANENCAILNSAGEVIPNLFGCGYVVAGNVYAKHSPASGLNLASCFSTGTIAARSAAAEIN